MKIFPPHPSPLPQTGGEGKGEGVFSKEYKSNPVILVVSIWKILISGVSKIVENNPPLA
jgi:hypothetical protein